jgi:type 1 glutamine amidotransferase
MRKVRFLFAAVAAIAVAGLPLATGQAQEKTKNKRLLLVTHSGGFVHPSVATAEEVLKEIGPKNGFDVTCWRFTEDPEKKVKTKDGKERTALEAYSDRFRGATKLTVEKENCGRINKETLKNFDVVLFFTTGNPVTKEELADLREWVKAGGALAGTHCATDTLYGESVYGDLIGAYFRGHPPGLQKIKVKVEDAKHPAAAGFTDGMEYRDEMYVFRDAPYSREKLHIILSIDPASFDPSNPDPKRDLTRKDKDYAISWCRTEGKGKVFYTSFGHAPEVWKDEKFQKHLLGGLKWATGELPGDATPSAKPPGGK